MKATFCPICEAERIVHAVQATEDVVIRGVAIPVKVEYLICDTCGGNFDLPGADDPLIEAYREYRSRVGFVQPEEIRNFRKEFGLTQLELSDLLGWGAATLSRYENGALQDEAHDRALRMIMMPANLLALVEKYPKVLPAEKRQAVLARYRSEHAIASELLDFIESELTSFEPDVRSGFRRFSVEKFIGAVLFFCQDKAIAKTKLNKLLWYSDFLHFKNHTVSITGARYAHCPFGPTPDRYSTLFAYMLDFAGYLRTEERSAGDFYWEELMAAHATNIGIFTAAELQTLVNVKVHFEDYTAKQISACSHGEYGYKCTEDGELISYEHAVSLCI